MRKPLPLLNARQEGLGLPTIMDRELAQQHGALYVQLVVFAIDIDRVCQLLEDNESLPLGWEIFMTEAFLMSLINSVSGVDGIDELQRTMLEDLCLDVLVDQGDPRLGSQLPFAVFNAVTRGALPESLRPLFHRWKSPSKSLLKDLAEFWKAKDEALPKLAQLCLGAPLDPPLAPPTVRALQKLVTAS